MNEPQISPTMLAKLEAIASKHRNDSAAMKEEICAKLAESELAVGAKMRELFAEQRLALQRANLSEQKAETLTALPAKEEEQPSASKPWRRPLPPEPQLFLGPRYNLG